MTKSQQKALDKLRELQAAGFPNRTAQGNIATGVNTTTLHNLWAAGLIRAKHVYLRGICSSDLKVTA